MKYSFIVAIKGKANAFGQLFAEIVGMDVRREDLEFIVADGGDRSIDLSRLSTKLSEQGIGFKMVRQIPGDHLVIGYHEAVEAARGDILIHVDPNFSLPVDFLSVVDEFAKENVALVPRPWRQVIDRWDRAPNNGYWVAPSFNTLVVPRDCYGNDQARWTFRDMVSPLEEFVAVSGFAKSMPVVVARYPGMRYRHDQNFNDAIALGKAWAITSPPTSAGIGENDARGVLYGRKPYTCGTLLPSSDLILWDSDFNSQLSEVVGDILKDLITEYPCTPDIGNMQLDLEDRLWRRYWAGRIPVIPRVTLNMENGNIRATSLNEVSLPFNREEDRDK